MAVYRKKLVDKDGNTIIPAVGDIYGTVYDATLSSATAGGRADYEFTPDTPLENNKVYAVKFPAPTVNNATIILGDGVSSGSILVPQVAATDAPNYELLTTDMINDTEPLLLMYNGVQWVCLNQKKKVATADLENNAVTSAKVNWTTFDDSWHNITLNSGIAVGNTNFTHANNRWRYENGGRDIRIQLNVGNSNGTQVPAGQSKNFASPSQFSFMPSGKFMRLCGSGQASALVWVEINTTSSPFARFAPITGASSYCALDVLIPKP